MDLSNVKIQTERLQLIPVSDEHLDEIHENFRLPLTQYMRHTSAGSMSELQERHQRWQRELQQGIKLFMAALIEESGEFIGCFALENLNKKNPEMGGWLKQSAHGNHYGREIAAALKQWADENLDHDYIVWPCAQENIASQKLAESLGGEVYREFDCETVDGKVWPGLEYRIPRG